MEAKKCPGVPSQIQGAFHDTESQKDFNVPRLAVQKYDELKKRFFDINHWKDYCGKASSDFKLYSDLGKALDRQPQVGDFVRIDIRGPGDFRAGGFDWVQIEDISDPFLSGEEIESQLMIFRPSRMPGEIGGNILHFYSQEATSTFRISRGENFIRVGIYGRNEVANYNHVGILNKIRNFIITLGGFAKVTKIQWKCLADGLLDF